jgi:hypothetical protein
MNWTRRDVFRVAGASALSQLERCICQAGPETSDKGIIIQPGQFSAANDSFKQYACPEWFRDAKSPCAQKPGYLSK